MSDVPERSPRSEAEGAQRGLSEAGWLGLLAGVFLAVGLVAVWVAAVAVLAVVVLVTTAAARVRMLVGCAWRGPRELAARVRARVLLAWWGRRWPPLPQRPSLTPCRQCGAVLPYACATPLCDECLSQPTREELRQELRFARGLLQLAHGAAMSWRAAMDRTARANHWWQDRYRRAALELRRRRREDAEPETRRKLDKARESRRAVLRWAGAWRRLAFAQRKKARETEQTVWSLTAEVSR
ncbi:hypothetical protein [Stigmatella aurantiaca]|uniref:hypothetical protein n=1 Tax=Stigmatella aurantiaca TaxID=41 RepID=UPI00067506B8|nr:hypothetical protein [Stigmatella aurantiaca]